jgi:hypothetical protein
MSFRPAALAAALLLSASLMAPAPAAASAILVAANSTASEFNARIRWGGSGWEAAILDPTPGSLDPNLNPAGAPVWQAGRSYAFGIDWAAESGTLTLKVDFNRDSSFAVAETISRSVFAGSPTSYAGRGFEFISISGNEGGSSARSSVSGLAINGSAQADMAPAGGFLERFYAPAAGGAFGDVSITGMLSFATAGTSQERPSWNFAFRGPQALPEAPAAVPEPAALALMGAGLLALALLRARRREGLRAPSLAAKPTDGGETFLTKARQPV